MYQNEDVGGCKRKNIKKCAKLKVVKMKRQGQDKWPIGNHFYKTNWPALPFHLATFVGKLSFFFWKYFEAIKKLSITRELFVLEF